MNLYSVWHDKPDDDSVVAIDLPPKRCAELMGVTLNYFYKMLCYEDKHGWEIRKTESEDGIDMTDQDREIWKAGYDIHDKHGDGPVTDADWNTLVEDCRALYNRFGGCGFAFHMAAMLVDYYSDKVRNEHAPRAEQTRMAV